MPLDESGEASALTSWNIGKGKVVSTMMWTNNWILYFPKELTDTNYYISFTELKVKLVI